MHLQEAHSYRPISPISQFYLAVKHKLSVVRTLLERSRQLVTVSQDKIQEDAHVEEALRACRYPPDSF